MTEEQDKIIEAIADHILNQPENANPCMKCGSVQCAFCYDDVRKMLITALSKGKEIGIEKAKQENNSDTELTSNLKAFKKSMDVEDIDLAKLGITETATTPQATSYIRGYLKRNFGIQVKEPIDWYLHCFASDSAMKGYEEGEKNQASKIAELEDDLKVMTSVYNRLDDEVLRLNKIITDIREERNQIFEIWKCPHLFADPIDCEYHAYVKERPENWCERCRAKKKYLG